MTDEDYIRFTGTLVARTPDGALIKTEKGEGWVARRCLSWSTDQAVGGRNAVGSELVFRAMEWSARKAGIA